MKPKHQWKEYCFVAIAFILYCIVNRYNNGGYIWIVNIIFAIPIGIYILRDLKPAFENEVSILRTAKSTDFVGAFVSCSISVAIIITLFVAGFTGRIGYSESFYAGDTFFDCLLVNASFLFFFMAISFFVSFVVFVPIGALFSSIFNYESQFSIQLFQFGCMFIMLFHVCGVVDIFKIVLFISNIWHQIRY